jgi:hypothetical protein
MRYLLCYAFDYALYHKSSDLLRSSRHTMVSGKKFYEIQGKVPIVGSSTLRPNRCKCIVPRPIRISGSPYPPIQPKARDSSNMRRHSLWIIFTLILLCGCREATPTPLPAEEIISRAVTRLQETSGLHFVVERSGAPAFLDLGKTLSLRRMEGDYIAPDRVQATVRIITTGFVTEIEVIGIGDTQWETNPLSKGWQQLPPQWGFNPTSLFDSSTGLQPILEKDLDGLEYIGLEELEEWPGKSLYSLTGLLRASRIYRTTFGLIGPGKLNMSLWISPETFEVYRMVLLEEEEGEEEPSTWTIDFWNYDQVIEIEPPIPENSPTP